MSYKFTLEQQENLDRLEGNSNYRLQMGQKRLREFVGWVFTYMPAIAPLPNMVKLIGAITIALGSSQAAFITAFLICLSIELMLFGVSEQLNAVIDKTLRAKKKDQKLFYVPLCITSIGAVIIVLIMMLLVYTYEVATPGGHWVSMTLPLISVLSVGFMGVRSYMKIVQDVKDDENLYNDKVYKLKQEVNTLQENLSATFQELNNSNSKLKEVISINEQLNNENLHVKNYKNIEGLGVNFINEESNNNNIEDVKNENLHLKTKKNTFIKFNDTQRILPKNIENSNVNFINEQPKTDVKNYKNIDKVDVNNENLHVKNYNFIPDSDVKKYKKADKITNRRKNLLIALIKTNSKNELNYTELEDIFEVTRQTISNDFTWLKNNGYWNNGDEWCITEKGEEFLQNSVY